MLKRLATPKLVPQGAPQAAPGHEDLFMQRYARLLAGARRLTGDPGRAEDLVHNAFVQFMLARPELASIKDPDGYLLIMLRNMNVSQARRAALMPSETLSAAEYDSAEAGLRALDAYSQLQVREQLSLICDYVCRRKERSKIGSALILRFFHGYYPAEVSLVLRSSRNVADKWLSLARHEAQAYVEDPASLILIASPTEAVGESRHVGGSTSEFLSELRRRIFAAQSGRCSSRKKLRGLYLSNETETADTEYASHLVSCARCLDEVNALLGLPSLSERFPMEAFGNDPRPPRGSGPGDSGGGSMSGGEELDKLKQVSHRRMRDVLEHRPKELRVAVNGYVLGSQSLSAESNKLALTVNTSERMGFVEVFSEQGFCLMFSSVGAPPDGPLEQEAHVELSEGRTLDLNLNFSGPWPTVNLLYSDPTFGSDETARVESAQIAEASPLSQSSAVVPELSPKGKVSHLRSIVSHLELAFTHWSFWTRPGTVTALVALLVISALLFTQLRTSVPILTAADLLQRSALAEGAIATNRDHVVHRTITLEEKATSGELVARRRIDVWQNAEKGITARRLYDERNQLIAGDWRRSDGVQTLYHHGSQPQLQIRNPKSEIRNFEEVWQLSPSASEFSSLIANQQQPLVQETAKTYVVTYDAAAESQSNLNDDNNGSTRSEAAGAPSSNPTAPPATIVRASLVLNRSDLRAIDETLLLREGNETREYRFTETAYELKAPSAVEPSVFEPESELLSARPSTPNAPPNSLVLAPAANPLLPVTASSKLEVEILQRLNQAGALLGEQVSLTRTREGLLRIQGIVESDQRKEEILNALGPALNERAVRVDLQTVNEAVARQRRSSSGAVTVQQLESSKATITVDSELRQYFSGRRGLSGEQLDREIRAFSDQMIGRSRQARRHALALKQITERFSSEEVRKLDPVARAQWRALVGEHARAFQQEISALRRDLQPIFGDASEEGRAEIEVSGDEDFARAAKRLFEFASANDDAVRTAFSISDESASASRIRSPQFWHALATAGALAAKIAAKSVQ